jgi:hypothetical protein
LLLLSKCSFTTSVKTSFKQTTKKPEEEGMKIETNIFKGEKEGRTAQQTEITKERKTEKKGKKIKAKK